MNYNKCAPNDPVMSWRGKRLELFNSHIQDWWVAFADIGIQSQKLVDERQLIGCPDGFWRSLDTVKDEQLLERQWGPGTAPWENWKSDCNNTDIANIAAPRETSCIL